MALLYGDHGEDSVQFSAVGDVMAVSQLVTAGLERILLRRKMMVAREPPPRDASTIKMASPVPPAPEAARKRISIGPRDSSAIDREWDDVAYKRGRFQEDEVVDQGWELTPDSVVTGSSEPATLPKERVDIPAPPLPPSGMAPVRRSNRPARKPARDNPPPPTAAAVRPIGGKPLAREEPDDPPELIVGETEVDAAVLLGQVEPVAMAPRPERRASSMIGRLRAEPPESTRISIDPRMPPLSSRGPQRNLPPVLINSDLVDRVIAGGATAESARFWGSAKR